MYRSENLILSDLKMSDLRMSDSHFYINTHMRTKLFHPHVRINCHTQDKTNSLMKNSFARADEYFICMCEWFFLLLKNGKNHFFVRMNVSSACADDFSFCIKNGKNLFSWADECFVCMCGWFFSSLKNGKKSFFWADEYFVCMCGWFFLLLKNW